MHIVLFACVVFLHAGVYRVSKGNQFALVNAMLHKSDLSSTVLQSLQKANSKHGGGHSGLLDKGTKLTVYVKEVYKQSG